MRKCCGDSSFGVPNLEFPQRLSWRKRRGGISRAKLNRGRSVFLPEKRYAFFKNSVPAIFKNA
jgi:hypothetical protein